MLFLSWTTENIETASSDHEVQKEVIEEQSCL
jgi:hypothetical protein